MEKRTREIIAVVMLVVLGIGLLIAMGWYILVGHNWNTAASYIDDSIGEMEGYTVVLFEGTTPPAAIRARISHSQPMLDDENRAGPVPAEDKDVSEPVTLEEIASSYRQKGANVFIIHPETPQIYSEPIIFNKNGYWMGVFYSDKNLSRAESARRASTFIQRGCNLVVEIADKQNRLQKPTNGVDVAIFPNDIGLPWRGANVNGTLNIDSPYTGEVQAVIISPSNSKSTRTATEP